MCPSWGGQESRKSDARAQGTNPRFPWKPSAAMLTSRLKAPRSFRGQPRRTSIMIPPLLTRAQQATTAESSRTTVRLPGAGLLTWAKLVHIVAVDLGEGFSEIVG